VEHRQAQVLLPALAGRHPADHPRAVGDRLLGVEGPLGSRDALADDLGVLGDEDGHGGLSAFRTCEADVDDVPVASARENFRHVFAGSLALRERLPEGGRASSPGLPCKDEDGGVDTPIGRLAPSAEEISLRVGCAALVVRLYRYAACMQGGSLWRAHIA